jgi:hypothetical protein
MHLGGEEHGADEGFEGGTEVTGGEVEVHDADPTGTLRRHDRIGPFDATPGLLAVTVAGGVWREPPPEGGARPARRCDGHRVGPIQPERPVERDGGAS